MSDKSAWFRQSYLSQGRQSLTNRKLPNQHQSNRLCPYTHPSREDISRWIVCLFCRLATWVPKLWWRKWESQSVCQVSQKLTRNQRNCLSQSMNTLNFCRFYSMHNCQLLRLTPLQSVRYCCACDIDIRRRRPCNKMQRNQQGEQQQMCHSSGPI